MSSHRIEKIKKYNAIFKSVLVSIAIFASGYIQTVFVNNHNGDNIVYIIFSVIILLVFVEFTSRFMEHIIDTNPALRKLLLRKDFYEGLWIDITEENTLALIYIEYEDGYYVIHGESYNANGELIGGWKSVNTWTEKGKLECYYKANYDDQVSDFEGRNEFSFLCCNNSIPNRFTGYYMDISNEFRQYRIAGERISKEDSDKFKNQKNVRDFVKNWASENEGILIKKK